MLKYTKNYKYVFLTYNMAKNLSERIKILKIELRKWENVISCIGRDPYILGASKEYCSLDRGGAINALGEKELYKLHYSGEPYYGYGTQYEYHRPARKKELDKETSKRTQDPSPETARELIVRSLESIVDTKNPLRIKGFKTKRKEITEELMNSRKTITIPYEPGVNYFPIQKNLSDTVRKIVNIEDTYKYGLSRLEKERAKELVKKGVKVGAVAASVAVGVVILSKVRKIKYLLSLIK